MAASSLPANKHTALEMFRADAQRLDKHDWRLWSIAGVIMIMMLFTIASLALEVERDGVDFMSGVQLDIGVRGLLTMVLLFVIFVLYQQVVIHRTRQNMVKGLRSVLVEREENPPQPLDSQS